MSATTYTDPNPSRQSRRQRDLPPDDSDESHHGDSEGSGEEQVPCAQPTGTEFDNATFEAKRRATTAPFVDHASVRHRIATGYESQAAPAQAHRRPHVYLFSDEVTRSLAGKKNSAKLTEYRLTCINGFFLSCANQALLEAVEALDSSVPADTRDRFSEIYNTFAAIENILRDRKVFLAIQNDPNATQDMRVFADTILRRRFEHNLTAYGPSADTVELYHAFVEQVATQVAISRLCASAM